MRRLHLRGLDNIAKRLLIHTAGFNLGLLMRRFYGLGKPRSAPRGSRGRGGRSRAVFCALMRMLAALDRLSGQIGTLIEATMKISSPVQPRPALQAA
jgi:hypothetical protein